MRPLNLDGDPLQLAMLGINPITAYCLLHGYVKLAPGAWVAQTGASSATAGYVLALAKRAGLRTLNVVRRAESVKPLLDAGADVVLVEGAGLTEQAADAIGDASVELILDPVAGEPVGQRRPRGAMARRSVRAARRALRARGRRCRGSPRSPISHAR
jgi:NADPH:quinone reductase-like Zn-dependent oxidoreductase